MLAGIGDPLLHDAVGRVRHRGVDPQERWERQLDRYAALPRQRLHLGNHVAGDDAGDAARAGRAG